MAKLLYIPEGMIVPIPEPNDIAYLEMLVSVLCDPGRWDFYSDWKEDKGLPIGFLVREEFEIIED